MRRFLAIAAVLGVSAWAFAAYVINPPQFNVSLNCYTNSSSGACLPLAGASLTVTGAITATAGPLTVNNNGAGGNSVSVIYADADTFLSLSPGYGGLSGTIESYLAADGVNELECPQAGCTFDHPVTTLTDAGTKAPVPSMSGVNGAAPSTTVRFEGVALGFNRAQAADAGFFIPFSVAPQCVWTATYTDGGLGTATASAALATSVSGVTLYQTGTPANGTEIGNALCWGY